MSTLCGLQAHMGSRHNIEVGNFASIIKKLNGILQLFLLWDNKSDFNVFHIWIFNVYFVQNTLNSLIIMTNIQDYFLWNIFNPFKSARLWDAFHKIFKLKWNPFLFTNLLQYLIRNEIIDLFMCNLLRYDYQFSPLFLGIL